MSDLSVTVDFDVKINWMHPPANITEEQRRIILQAQLSFEAGKLTMAIEHILGHLLREASRSDPS